MVKFRLDWNDYQYLSKQVAREGTVLIKNDKKALPLSNNEEVSIYGRIQTNYYKSGTGSGGMVNVDKVFSIREAFEIDKNLSYNNELAEIYDMWEQKNPIDKGIGWGNEPWSQKEMPLEEETVKKFSQINSTAVICIGRTAGEDLDNKDEFGAYRLSIEEEKMLELVCKYYDKSIVLLNVGNIIDMSFVRKYNPSAVLYIWQAGMVGALPTLDILAGREYPSGCLADTIASSLDDYPSTSNFGNKDINQDLYEEDIYVGYRYFSTFAEDKVLYPFGFGLSYTEFTMEVVDFREAELDFTVRVRVQNVGDFKGKATAMIFVTAPNGILSKPKYVLCAFDKTDELKPGESQTLVMTIKKRTYASFDDDNRLGLGHGFILEKGVYEFSLGSNVRDVKAIGSFVLSENKMVELLEQEVKPQIPFKRMIKGTDGLPDYEDVPLKKIDNLANCMKYVQPEIKQTGDRNIKLIDVKNGKNTMDEFIAQLDDEDLSLIIRGEGMCSPKVTMGTAAAYCGVNEKFVKMGIPPVCCSDGPSGIRMDDGKKAFAMPNGALIACTFNVELVESLFEMFGIEMLSNKVDSILGPGINIHRNPLNGRNFEYFSEDPFLTGKMAVAELNGLHKTGVTGTIKHFALNNRETSRRYMDSVVSERAMREIYLVAFEMAIKEANARSIMTVYNKINGVYGAGNYDLNTVVLRQQFGYKGIVMTDWWAFIDVAWEQREKVCEHSMMARAQNDIYMVRPSVELDYLNETDVFENLKNNRVDLITRAELQRNVKNILNFAMNTPAMQRLNGEEIVVEHIDCPFNASTGKCEANHYFDVEEVDEIVIDDDTSNGEAYMFGVNVKTLGFYELEIFGSSDLDAVAQIPMTIFYMNVPNFVVTWNGTEGKVDSRKITIRLATNPTVLKFEFKGAGVDLKSIKFKYVCPIESVESWRTEALN